MLEDVMLKEIRKTDREAPVRVEYVSINNYPLHQNEELEILYVIKGSIDLDLSLYHTRFPEKNLIVVNHSTLHSIRETDEENRVLVFYFDLDYFSKYSPGLKEDMFICDTTMQSEESERNEFIKQIMRDLAAAYFSGSSEDKQVNDLAVKCLLCLENHFLYWQEQDSELKGFNTFKEKPVQIRRFQRILGFMHKHYNEKITLDMIAELEHLDKYYISHLISSGFGTSFQNALLNLRVDESRKMLHGTGINVEEVAIRSGFSSVGLYRKHFQKLLGMSPSEERKLYKNNTISIRSPEITVYSPNEGFLPMIYAKGSRYRSGAAAEDSIFSDSTAAEYGADLIKTDIRIDRYSNQGVFWDTLLIEDIRLWFKGSFWKRLTALHDELAFRNVSVRLADLSLIREALGTWEFIESLLEGAAVLQTGFIIQADEGSCDVKELTEYMGQLSYGAEATVVDCAEALNRSDFQGSTVDFLRKAFSHRLEYICFSLEELFYDIGLRRNDYYIFKFLCMLGGKLLFANERLAVSGNGKESCFEGEKKGRFEGADGYRILLINDAAGNTEHMLRFSNEEGSFAMISYHFDTGQQSAGELWNAIGGADELSVYEEEALISKTSPAVHMDKVLLKAEDGLYFKVKEREIVMAILRPLK